MASRLNPWKIQGYKPGQNVICKIAKAEPGGYAVIIPKDNLPGYLPSNARHNVGDEVLATFVCIDKNRMLLSERFTHGKGDLIKRSGPNWEEHLNELDPNYATGGQDRVQDTGSYSQQFPTQQQYSTGPLPSQGPNNPDQFVSGGFPQQLTGQMPGNGLADQFNAQQLNPTVLPQYSQPMQLPGPHQQLPTQQPSQQQAQPYPYGPPPGYEAQQFTPPPQEYPQRYGENVPSRRYQLRRAIDLIMPPIDPETLRSMRIGDYDVEWLITQLEGGMHTGCVKASCESKLSRAAMLLYKGRAVGCIYGSKADPTTKPTEESLQAMLSDLEASDTVVTLYDLPEEITLAMSSLFLGYPVERHDDYSAKEYLDYICSWLGQKNGTATLAISLTEDRGTCLGYIYKGTFGGAFYVEDQKFRADRAFVDEMLTNDPRAALEVSILPPEMHASAVRFGFSLSMARTRKLE